ncbi:regulatory protein RecX [Adlercreutzia sp.]|uniref:regulatory protein RecX n=1 Tax=Adlercreutzia sp. TaxID=1872387 RepID=UPI002F935284
MASKADILAALRADIAALEAAPPSEEPCAQIAAWPHPAEDDAVCGRDTGASCAQDLSRSSRGEERESALSGEEGKTARDAYQKILRWAAVRERSTAYLRERLLKDDFPAAVVEEALQRAVRVRAVDDRRYADALVRMKLAAGRGLRDAEREIEELGIDPATLDSWVEHERKGRDFEVGRALAALRRRPPKAKRAREAAFRRLVSQGFSTDVAATASRTWFEERERGLMCGSMGHS